MDTGNGLDVLDKVQLFVARGCPKVITDNRFGLSLEFAFVGDIGDAALFTKGRIGQHHVKAVAGVCGQAVIDTNRADGAVLADAV